MLLQSEVVLGLSLTKQPPNSLFSHEMFLTFNPPPQDLEQSDQSLAVHFEQGATAQDRLLFGFSSIEQSPNSLFTQ